VLNLHPALLPSFKGAHAIADAYDAGVKVTGITVHFANEDYDKGPIVAQRAVEVREDDTLEALEARIHEVEHVLYVSRSAAPRGRRPRERGRGPQGAYRPCLTFGPLTGRAKGASGAQGPSSGAREGRAYPTTSRAQLATVLVDRKEPCP